MRSTVISPGLTKYRMCCGPTYPYIQLLNPHFIQNQLSHNLIPYKTYLSKRRLEDGSHFWRACPTSGGRSIGRHPNPARFKFKPPALLSIEGARMPRTSSSTCRLEFCSVQHFLLLEDLYWSLPHRVVVQDWLQLVFR